MIKFLILDILYLTKNFGTGFKFLYALEESIKEMIEKWSRKFNKDLEYVNNGQTSSLTKEVKLAIMN